MRLGKLKPGKLKVGMGICLLAMSACQNGAVKKQQDVPALISEPTPAARAELEDLVTTALNGAEVTLADKALTESSTLMIERQPRRGPHGNRVPGRDLSKPEQFHLVLRGDKCLLLHRGSDQPQELKQANCIPAKQ